MSIQINLENFFKIIAYLRDNSSVDFKDEKFVSIISDEFSKTNEYYEQVINQNTHTDLLGDLIKQWYTANKAFLTQTKMSSNIDMVDTDLLLRSFGYPYSGLHSSSQKKSLCLNINSMYARKCEPEVINDVLKSFGVSNMYLFEYWVRKKNDQILLVPEVVIRSGVAFLDNLNELEVELDSAVMSDPHWRYTEAQLLALNAQNKIRLPSLSPYFGVAFASNWLDNRKVILALVRIMRNQYNEWMYGDAHATSGNILFDPAGFNPDAPQQGLAHGDVTLMTPAGNISRDIYIPSFGNVISLLELMMSISYVYNKTFLRTTTYDEPNELKHYELLLGDEFLDDDVMLVNELNKTYTMPDTRAERDQLLQDEKDKFLGNNPFEFVKTPLGNGPTLQKLSSTYYDFLNSYIDNGIGSEILYELLQVLDFHVSNLGYEPCNFIFCLPDTAKSGNAVKTVINHFKPYHCRLLSYMFYLIFKDIPGDVLRIDDNMFQSIYHKIVDIFPDDETFNWRKDKLFTKIKHSILDDQWWIRYNIDNADVLNIAISDQFSSPRFVTDDRLVIDNKLKFADNYDQNKFDASFDDYMIPRIGTLIRDDTWWMRYNIDNADYIKQLIYNSVQSMYPEIQDKTNINSNQIIADNYDQRFFDASFDDLCFNFMNSTFSEDWWVRYNIDNSDPMILVVREKPIDEFTVSDSLSKSMEVKFSDNYEKNVFDAAVDDSVIVDITAAGDLTDVVVNNENVSLSIWDYNIEDQDSVDIYLNDSLIAEDLVLYNTPNIFNLVLNNAINTIKIVAKSVGIPGGTYCTARIQISNVISGTPIQDFELDLNEQDILNMYLQAA